MFRNVGRGLPRRRRRRRGRAWPARVVAWGSVLLATGSRTGDDGGGRQTAARRRAGGLTAILGTLHRRADAGVLRRVRRALRPGREGTAAADRVVRRRLA